MTEVLVANIEDIPPGEGRMFAVDGGEIAVFRTHEGSVHATQAYCPHLGGPLADGLTSEKTVVCPLHDRTFDLVAGCGLTHERMDIKVYKSRLEANGDIWVVPGEMSERAPIYVGADAHIHAASQIMEEVGSS